MSKYFTELGNLHNDIDLLSLYDTEEEMYFKDEVIADIINLSTLNGLPLHCDAAKIYYANLYSRQTKDNYTPRNLLSRVELSKD